MGSFSSKQDDRKKSDHSRKKKNKNIFGTGVHVGRNGNVDLAGRGMLFLGNKIVNMINNDDLHRTATSLTLSHNKLYTIGKEMSLLPNIRELYLDDNKLERLPKILSVLQKLWKINASMNPLDSYYGFEVLPSLTALRSLALCKCDLVRVPPPVSNCKFLEELDLSDNPSIRLSEGSFLHLERLTMLKLANCGLNGAVLPSNIKSITTLMTLDISNNNFSNFDQNFFGPNIAKTLINLHLRNLGLSSIPPVVVVLKKLQFIDLACNPITTLDVLAGRLVRRFSTSTGANQTCRSSDMQVECKKVNLLAPNTTDMADQIAKEDRILSPKGPEADVSISTPTIMVPKQEKEAFHEVESNGFDEHASLSSRISMSKISKAGMIATVTRPILIKKLSLRNCGLRSAPKYFHKLTDLEELDLSENYNLEDPNMTLFSLQNLRVLNVVGCPFAENRNKSKNEWFDIAKLQNLKDIQWEQWMGIHNLSPYRTRIPIELCGLALKRINQIDLRSGLFVGETIETAINLLRDGYFKVDLSVDDKIVDSYMEAIHVFTRAKEFFYPKEVTLKPGPGKKSRVISGTKLGQCHLRITISRYIFFLSIQAANYDAIFIPPLDVMIAHYSQITLNPVKYRADCEAIGGRVLDCNYRSFFHELSHNPAAAMKAIAASKVIWNLMVRSAYKELTWLRYDFWSRRMHKAQKSASEVPQSTAEAQPTQNLDFEGETDSENVMRLLFLYKNPVNQTDEVVLDDFEELCKMDTSADLTKIIDSSITMHFLEQDTADFSKTVEEFFQCNDNLIANESTLSRLSWDWTRYLKYLALYAYRISLRSAYGPTPPLEMISDTNGSSFTPFCPEKSTSILGPHYDSLQNISFSNPDKYLPIPQQSDIMSSMCLPLSRPSAVMHSKHQQKGLPLSVQSAIKQFKVDPVPTMAITILLYAHRTSHNRYFQTLSLLRIESIDITWKESTESIEETKTAWKALYDELYVSDMHDFKFWNKWKSLDHPFIKKESLKPIEIRESSSNSSLDFETSPKISPDNNGHSLSASRKMEMRDASFYSPHMKPSGSILVKRISKKSSLKSTKKVLFCTGFES